jgi:predicted MFS family arabinose efflux permease
MTVGVVLFAAGAGWTGGNVGPAVTQISRAFEVSLSAVGLLMTVFFAAIAVITVFAPPLANHIGVGRTVVLACVLLGLGNVVFAASPLFSGLLLSRVLVGLGAGFAFVVGPMVARASGGLRLLGLFGGAVTLGIALALGIGGLLVDVGLNWRIGFVISALVGISALPAFSGRVPAAAPSRRSSTGFLSAALRSSPLWRLMLLFIHANGITLVVSTWLIHYLTEGGNGMGAWLAGLLGFVLFAVTTVMRPVGGRLAGSGFSATALAGLSPLLAAAGLIGLAVERSFVAAILWILLMGVGFALPYATMIDEAQRLFPNNPAAVLAFLQTGPNLAPMVIIPLVGVSLERGYSTAAFVLLGVFVALAGLANVHPATPPVDNTSESI